MRWLAQVGFESGLSSPVIATGVLGDGDGVCFLVCVLASEHRMVAGTSLQSIPVTYGPRRVADLASE